MTRSTLLGWVNPLAPFVESSRDVLYSGTAPDAGRLVYVILAGVIAVLAGRAVFARMQGDLAVVV